MENLLISEKKPRIFWTNEKQTHFKQALIKIIQDNMQYLLEDEEVQDKYKQKLSSLENISDFDLIFLIEKIKQNQPRLFSTGAQIMNSQYKYQFTRKQLQTKYDSFKRVYYNQEFDLQTYKEIRWRLEEEYIRENKFKRKFASQLIHEFQLKKHKPNIHKYTAFAKIQYMMKQIEMSSKRKVINNQDICDLQQIIKLFEQILSQQYKQQEQNIDINDTLKNLQDMISQNN